MTRELRLTGPVAMRALAHPLRMRMLGSLRIDGPATASTLARRFDTDSGQTSHHLRQLAKYGFVEEATDLGKGPRGRERWWRAAQDTTSWDSLADFGPEGMAAVNSFEDAAHAVWANMLAQYRRERAAGEWSSDWSEAAASGDYHLRTTPDGLAAMLEEIREVFARYDDQGSLDPEARPVSVLLHAFPRGQTP